MCVVIKEMTLKPNVGSDRSWVYTAHDYSEGEPTTELLAVRFANAENANLFKEKFEEAQKINSEERSTEEQSNIEKAEKTKKVELESEDAAKAEEGEEKDEKSEKKD